MSTFVVGDCVQQNLFERWDADATSETQFEYIVAKALSCIYSKYNCILFGGGFRLDDQVSRPDLALIAKDYSHWFIIEVELITHSLQGHVLPQVRAFQYGDPQPDCVKILARETGLPASQIQTFLRAVPRSVAVIVNKRNREWEIALGSLQVQMLTVTAFKSSAGVEAVEVDGQLAVLQEHLGFGTFSATYRSLRFPASVKLPDGEIMIADSDGSTGTWTVIRDGAVAWITKTIGVPDILHGSQIQLVRTYGGRISIRRSLSEF
jgi:hypothetical protein